MKRRAYYLRECVWKLELPAPKTASRRRRPNLFISRQSDRGQDNPRDAISYYYYIRHAQKRYYLGAPPSGSRGSWASSLRVRPSRWCRLVSSRNSPSTIQSTKISRYYDASAIEGNRARRCANNNNNGRRDWMGSSTLVFTTLSFSVSLSSTKLLFLRRQWSCQRGE